MKLVFSKKSIDEAPKTHTRIRLTEEARSAKRLVRENGVDTIEIGAGKGSEMDLHKFVTLCRSIVNTAKQQKAKKIVIQFDRSPQLFGNLQHLTPEQVSQIAAENYEMANFEFRSFKTKPKEGWTEVEEILLCGASSPSIETAAKRGQIIGQEVNACRELSNTPGGSMTPRMLATAAKKAVTGLPVTVQTLGRAQIEKLGMGLLAGVGAGSNNELTFTILEYKGGSASGKPIVLAGKGITFDSGGLNIKPSQHIYEMHMDMSGAASVIHTVALAAKLKLKKNVIGLVPAAENMLGPNATRPGDIHTSLSGKTVEVTDTDAEGRLILADAITYAKRFKPGVVIDIATLTGAVLSALGLYASGLMTRDDALSEKIRALGEVSGDYVWPLPLWDEYEDVVKGTFADLQNYPLGGPGRYGGATGAGMFLWQFAKELDCPWAHLDIASRMTSAPGDELAKGAAGAPVRLLLSFIEAWNS
ncbi:MAG: putative cytosol aminopeptidase [Parcubacteria group bacterium]|nr:putative cytosol aminopeptidase [Parcubacteria group bacterium]